MGLKSFLTVLSTASKDEKTTKSTFRSQKVEESWLFSTFCGSLTGAHCKHTLIGVNSFSPQFSLSSPLLSAQPGYKSRKKSPKLHFYRNPRAS